MRLLAFVPFAIAGAARGGDEGFVIAMWGFFPDAPIQPLFAITNWIGKDSSLLWIKNSCDALIYVMWYGGGGYLVGRWAHARFHRAAGVPQWKDRERGYTQRD